jgi:hypothetical protein
MRVARHPLTASRARRGVSALLAATALLAASSFGAVAIAAPTQGGIQPMHSVQLQEGLCQTTGGGQFVPIPGFPGESIDVRLLDDIAWMVQRYKIFITDGYATAGHAAGGEHPIGLAIDIIPNTAVGGKWRKVTKLARWAEPTQNQPRAPFRWVGYNGDAGHGRGNHLHLSWMHSVTKPQQPAETVYTRFCPPESTPAPPPPTPQLNQILRSLPLDGPQHD